MFKNNSVMSLLFPILVVLFNEAHLASGRKLQIRVVVTEPYYHNNTTTYIIAAVVSVSVAIIILIGILWYRHRRQRLARAQSAELANVHQVAAPVPAYPHAYEHAPDPAAAPAPAPVKSVVQA